jgi:hypothetical protein
MHNKKYRDKMETYTGENRWETQVIELEKYAENPADEFIREAGEMLRHTQEPSNIACLIRAVANEMMDICQNDEDALCLLIFRDSTVPALAAARERELYPDTPEWDGVSRVAA